MPLSAAAVRSVKGRDKPYKLTDGGGLYLHVTPNGSRQWRMNYRFGGKQSILSFAPLPMSDLRTSARSATRCASYSPMASIP